MGLCTRMYSKGKQGIHGCGKINANIYKKKETQCRVNLINFYNITYVTHITGNITHTPKEIRFSLERGEAVEV